MRLVVTLTAAALLSACATSKVTAFRDPAFAGVQFKSIVVFAGGMSLDAAVDVERQICAKVAPTPCAVGEMVLPPTRQYSEAERREYLARANVDAAFVVVLTGDQSNTQYLGTINNSTTTSTVQGSGTVNFYRNQAAWNGTATGTSSTQSMSTPLYGFSRVAYGQLELFDLTSGNVAWRGQIKVEGHGALNVRDSVFIDSATSNIATELKGSKLIP